MSRWPLSMELLRPTPLDGWRLEQACLGTLITGGTGGGKTSGPFQYVIRSFLRAGFGGIFLCVKNRSRSGHPGEMRPLSILLLCACCLARQDTANYFSVPPADAPELASRGPWTVGVRTVELVNPHQPDILRFDQATGKPVPNDPSRSQRLVGFTQFGATAADSPRSGPGQARVFTLTLIFTASATAAA